MTSHKFSILAAVATLTACAVAASVHVFRDRARQRRALQLREDLSTWEGEGGQPAPSKVRPAPSA